MLLPRHRAITWYAFGVAYLNSRGGGVVLKFEVVLHCFEVFCFCTVYMQALNLSVDDVPSQEQLYW